MSRRATPPAAAAVPAAVPGVARAPAEQVFARELAALAAHDQGPKPPGWRLTPRAVRSFLIGTDAPLAHDWEGARVTTPITRKFYGDDPLVERCIVTLMGNRGLLLVGEPGTAKSMLSELLAAAISGVSTHTIQGTAGTTEDHLKYSWNYARLLAEGPGLGALVPSPLYFGFTRGTLVRFEELTRCAPEIQDAMISLLSDKVLLVPELGEVEGVIFARQGFNLIATANLRDRGVHEMSSALKRRFNFETVQPIADPALELELVTRQTRQHLSELGAAVTLEAEVLELLVTTFHELRRGMTLEGAVVEKPSTVMSTAEAVSVALSASLDACYFGDGRLSGAHLVRQLVGTVLKDHPDDAPKLRQYFDAVVKGRQQRSPAWRGYYEARRWLTV